MITIEPAKQSDLPAVLNLLERNNLPTSGLAEHIASTLVARQGGEIMGSAALEIYGDAALLRSVAVDERLRGQGWGVTLTQAALDEARTRGIKSVYLLTETAAGFFPRFGFQTIARADVPANVQQSVEFVFACADSALVMATDI